MLRYRNPCFFAAVAAFDCLSALVAANGIDAWILEEDGCNIGGAGQLAECAAMQDQLILLQKVAGKRSHLGVPAPPTSTAATNIATSGANARSETRWAADSADREDATLLLIERSVAMDKIGAAVLLGCVAVLLAATLVCAVRTGDTASSSLMRAGTKSSLKEDKEQSHPEISTEDSAVVRAAFPQDPAEAGKLMRQVLISWVIMFAEGFYATQILPYCPGMTEALRGTRATVGFYSGLLYTANSAGMLLSSYFWAKLSNRIGRRPCILMSLSACMAANALMAMTSSYWMMVAMRFFAGLVNCNLSLMRTSLREVFEHANAEDTWAFSTLSVAFGASSVVGPSLGGLLYGHHLPLLGDWQYSWTMPWLLCSLFYAISLSITSLAMPETAFLNRPAAEAASSASGLGLLKDISFLLLLTLGGGHSYVFTGWEHVYPLLASIPLVHSGEAWSAAQVGVTFLIGSFTLMFFSLALYPVLARKVPRIYIWIFSWIPPVLMLPLFPRLLTWLIWNGVNSNAMEVQALNYAMQIITSMLLGSGFISIQLLLNEYVSKLPNSSGQLALANSMLVSTQAFVRALSPMVNGSLFTLGRKGEETTEAIHAIISRALPFDSLATVGLVACIACAVWFRRRQSAGQT